MKLDIKYLQQLDFLLSIINANEHSKEYKIIFGLYHEEFTGKFIPNYNSKKIELKDLTARDSDEVVYVYSKNAENFKGINKRSSGFEDDSKMTLLIKRSNDFNSYDYYRLLQEVLKEYPLDFNEVLPNYIYDLKSTNNDFETKEFVEIPEDKIFDYVRIVPADK